MNSRPSLKTLEEFCAFYEKDTPENKAWLFEQYQFAMKERQRLRDKDRARRTKIKKERENLPPEQRKKIGRPRKNPPPMNIPAPGAGDSA